MSRRTLHVLTLASAVICVASLVLVARSVFRVDVIEALTSGYPYAGGGMATVNGQCWLVWHFGSRPLDNRYHLNYQTERTPAIRPRLDQLWSQAWGVRWLGVGAGTSPQRVLILPLWLVPIVTAILPLKRWRRRR